MIYLGLLIGFCVGLVAGICLTSLCQWAQDEL